MKVSDWQSIFRIIRLFVGFVWLCVPAMGQKKLISRSQFFKDDSLIQITLSADLRRLEAQMTDTIYEPAILTWQNAKGESDISAPVKIRLRGNFRRKNCDLASLMVDFKTDDQTSPLRNLKRMKWVAPCKRGLENEQYLVKEYLVYRMYNLFTDLSFRVRMMRVTFEDAANKRNAYTRYVFAIEDVDDLADRNGMVEEDQRKYATEQTNRAHTTMVALFQYMIGNIDWSVPVYQNIKLLLPKDSLKASPYVVPYDFDYCGLVNAPYAIPLETLGIESVTERIYFGFPRTMDELKASIEKFKLNRDAMERMITTNPYLELRHEHEMIRFLKGFFDIVSNDFQIKKIFIDNARTR